MSDSKDLWELGQVKGRQDERERIIKLLEDNCKCGIWRDHLIGCPHEVAIALIKGEQNEDACEPSDSPCVNGWSCQKHRKTIEQLIDFLAEINGENK